MKKIIQIFYLFPAFIVAVMSCQKEPIEPLTELTVDGEQKVIAVEKNGIGIEFCLLNEEGEPATVFNKGENLKFHLAIENNIEPDTDMYIVSEFLKNPDLFKVFKSNGDTVGKPVEWAVMEKIGDAVNLIEQSEKWVMEIPWHETRGTEEPFVFENLIRFFQHFFIGLDQPPLSKGKYYTEFTQQFCLGRYFINLEEYVYPPYDYECTKTLTLKINFEII